MKRIWLYVVTSYKFSSGSAAIRVARKYLIAVITLGNFARKVSLRRARGPRSNFILISAPLSSEAVLASNVTFVVVVWFNQARPFSRLLVGTLWRTKSRTLLVSSTRNECWVNNLRPTNSLFLFRRRDTLLFILLEASAFEYITMTFRYFRNVAYIFAKSCLLLMYLSGSGNF